VGGTERIHLANQALTAHLTMPTPIEIGSFEYRGSRLAYELHGAGERTLVYLHGLLMDSQMNRGLAEALAEQGVRVALLDLLGHGRSDKPLQASAYRMDSYADEVVAFLDHLGVDRAVIGGVSLGADVSLQVVVRAPERVAGLLLEMPVLEWAVPTAAMLFTPLLLAMHYASGPAGLVARLLRRVPRTGMGSIDSVLEALSAPPEVVKAVLHGILTGPVAPTVEQRRAIAVPMLVIAHTSDLIHPFSDAKRLVDIVPQGRLLPARSIFELRITPKRLTGEIATFLREGGSARGTAAATG
jgi:pimeloyl-ACP methyl ester carboxylesterase